MSSNKRFWRTVSRTMVVLLVLLMGQGAHAQKAYVPFTSSANVGVIDTEARTQELLVDIGGSTYSSALSPTGLVAYVADFSNNRIIPIDTSTNTAGTAIPVGNAPVNITFSPDGSLAYISNYVGNSFSIIDTTSGAVTETITAVCDPGRPIQSVYSTNGLYFVCESFPSAVRLMDITTFDISTVASVGDLSYNLALDEAANRLYVSNFASNTVSVIDLTDNSIAATIGLSGEFTEPLGIGLALNGSILLVADYGSLNLNIIDTQTNAITNTINLGVNSAGLGVSSNGAVAYIVGRGLDAGIAVFDTASQTVVQRIPTSGTNPIAIWGDFLGNVAAQPPGLFNVGGTVSGLEIGKELVLRNNGGDDLRLDFNGNFNFPTGLEDGDRYLVSISTQPDGQTCSVARNEGVISGASVTDIEVTCSSSTAPDAPTITSVTAGDGQLEVAFTAGADNGSAITNYEYSLDGGSFVAFSPATTSSPVVIDGLTNGTTYAVQLRAINDEGAGAPSNSVDGTPVAVPAAPSIGAATAGNGQASVSFTPPTDNGGTTIIDYTATSSPSGFTGTCSNSPCTVAGLTNGTAYTFTVTARNSVGVSSPSAATNPVTPAGPPGAPLQVEVNPGERSLTISWIAPSDNGGSPILRYRAEANPTCEVDALVDEVPGETIYSCTITNLNLEQEYTITVVAISAAGEGAVASAATAARPQAVIPVPIFSPWGLMAMILLMLALPMLVRRSTA